MSVGTSDFLELLQALSAFKGEYVGVNVFLVRNNIFRPEEVFAALVAHVVVVGVVRLVVYHHQTLFVKAFVAFRTVVAVLVCVLKRVVRPQTFRMNRLVVTFVTH